MISLACVIVEMLMPAKVQLSTCGLTGKQRERAIIKLCETKYELLPRFENMLPPLTPSLNINFP